MLLTCSLAKLSDPTIDIRKPYTEIGTPDSFSGRAEYDEKYIWPFAVKHKLPINSTTAFLTPGFRTLSVPLARPLVISGRPKRMYVETIQLLDDVHTGRIDAGQLLTETLRQLLILQQEQSDRMEQLLGDFRSESDNMLLSSDEIVELIRRHIESPKASRLPVLIVAAAYSTVAALIGERARALHAHTAADLQTKAIGDVEITLVGDDSVITSYEVKDKTVTVVDIDLAIRKVLASGNRIDNYLIITTYPIDEAVAAYALGRYREMGGTEFAILDALGFLRHFLHFFHRQRQHFLERYQEMVLAEPDSSVNQPLKELFLVLRRAAEYDRGMM